MQPGEGLAGHVLDFDEPSRGRTHDTTALRSPAKRIEADEPAAWSSKRGNAAGIQPRAGNGGTADQREVVPSTSSTRARRPWKLRTRGCGMGVTA